MYNYPVAIEYGDENTAFGVVVPDVPGCFSAGDTLDEALENAAEAIEAHLELLAEDGEVAPEPNSVQVWADNPEYKGYMWGVVQIDETPFLGRSEKINVTLPTLVMRKIDEYTQTHKQYKNRSQFLAVAARRLLEEESKPQDC